MNIETARDITGLPNLTQLELDDYIKYFESEYDEDVFINRYKHRRVQYGERKLTYRQIMSGCYDVIDKPIDKLGWHLAYEKFLELVDKKVFFANTTYILAYGH